MARKQREADQLRAAEKFMVVGTGEAECTSCGFIYDPRKGDPEYPVGPGTQFTVRSALACPVRSPAMQLLTLDPAEAYALQPLARQAVFLFMGCGFMRSTGALQNLPGDWQCPICGAGKRSFQSKAKTLAGFEQNMQYGFGTNTMTSGQKSALIYGSLIVFFALFLFGYLLQ